MKTPNRLHRAGAVGLIGGFATLICAACSGKGGWKQARPSNEELILIRYDVKSVDPAAANDWTTAHVLQHVYPPIGKLAEIQTTDYRNYTLRVRPGSKFFRSRPVTAGDLRFTLDRCRAPGVRSPLGATYAGQLESVETVSDQVLRLRLRRKDVTFPSKLRLACFGVLDSKKAPPGAQLTSTEPGLGAGNYSVTVTDPGVEWKLSHFDRERGIDLRFRYLQDTAARISHTDDAKADRAFFAAHESGMIGPNRKVTGGGPTTLVVLQLNPSAEPALRDKNLRLKIAQAVREVEFSTYVGSHIRPVDAGLLSLSGLKEKYVPPAPVADLGKPSPAEITLYFASVQGGNPAVEAISQKLKTFGVRTRLQALPSSVLLRRNNDRDLGVLFTGWQPDFEGPLNTLPMLLHSGSPENHSGYRNLQVDRLLDAAQQGENAELNVAKAAALAEAEAYVIPLYIQQDLVISGR